MNFQSIVISMLVGWCGTPWPRPWPIPWPGPDPDPWLIKIVGVVGGIVGGLLIDSVAGVIVTDGFVANVVGAWIGARICVDIYGFAAKELKRT